MNKISQYARRVIYYSFISLCFLTPLVFYPFTKYFPFPWFVIGVDPFTYELFEYNKMFFVYGLTIVVATAWIVRCTVEKRIIFQRTFPDYALALFLLSQVLSTIYSIDHHTSIWGYYSRFHGGLLSTISYLLLYWAFVSNLFERKYLHVMLVSSIVSATLVSWYGIAQRMGVDAEYWVQNVRARVFSSLGQPNWLAAYVVAMLPISLSYFLFEKRVWYKLFYCISVASMFLCLVFTASRSGLLALVLGLLVYATLIYIKRVREGDHTIQAYIVPLTITAILGAGYIYGYYKYAQYALNFSLGILALSLWLLSYSYFRSHRLWIIALGVFIIISGFWNFSPETFRLGASGVAINTQTAIPQEAGGVETGRIRLIVWEGAWNIFRQYPIFGSGVETFAYSFYELRPLALLQTTEWDFLYNKAHNEYLNFLATTGAFGLGAYILYILHVFGFVGWSYFKRPQLTPEKHEELVIHSKNKSKQTALTLHYDHENYATLILIGIVSGFTTILITNFFGFSVVNVALYFFLFSGFLAVVLNHERKSFIYRLFVSRAIRVPGFSTPSAVQQTGIALACAVGVFTLFHLFSYWFADIAFADGRMNNRQSQIGQAHSQFLHALELRSDEPFYYSELGWTQGNMVYALMQDNDASSSAELAPFAEQNARRAVEMSPNNVNYWKKLADVYYNLTFFDKVAYSEKMVHAADRARTLAPTDVSTLLTLSIYYEEIGNLDRAYQVVEQCTKWKPDLGQGWYRLGQLAYKKFEQSKDERYKIQSDEYRFKASQLEPQNEEFKGGYE